MLSVLMPAYNAEKYIVEAIESALPALGSADRIVLQDGSPSDGTERTVRERFPDESRIEIVRARDYGQSDALNRALARVSTDYVLWLNADDVVDTATLKSALQQIRDEPGLDLVICGHRVVKADGEVLGTYRGKPLDRDLIMRRGCYIFSGSIIVRTSKLRELGGFRTDLHYCMDLDLMFRLAELDLMSSVIPGPLGSLRRHDESKSGTSARKFRREAWKVRGDHLRSATDHASRIRIAIEQPIVSAAKPIRFSRPYRYLRDRLWRRHG